MSWPSIARCVCLSATLLVGCAPAQERPETAEAPSEAPPPDPPADMPPGSDEVERTGRVVVAGTGGMRLVNLQTDGGETVGLTGDLLDELMRLTGAVVRVAGSPSQTVQGEGVNVASYDVVSVDGETPSVGVLAGGGDDFRLEGEGARALVDVPPELRSQVGAKIWVVGPETAGGQRVRSYGVIRPAG